MQKTLNFFGLILFLFVASLATVQAQDATSAQPSTQVAAQPSTATAILRGHIADPTGAMIPGAKVTLTSAKGKTLGSGVADSSGAYEFDGLIQGSYIVLALADGFAPFASKPIIITAGQSKRVDVAMAVEADQQSVIVTDESPTVSVEAGSNSNAIVLKGADLDALSDDPDELSSELTALAGPAAGPNGGQIYIDGFTGGQLPPKSSIREIRINQNPFSAEFDHIGYGRIEILTKPGTDKLHGSFFVQGNDSAFNTNSPFDKNVQPYNRIQFNGNITGSLGKNASFNLSVEDRDNHDVQVYDYFLASTYSIYNSSNKSDNYFASLATTKTSGNLANPHNRFNIAPRIDFQVGAKNTLTFRYQFYHDSESGDIGSQQTTIQSDSTTSNEQQIQASDSIIVNDHTVNEIRFQYIRDLNTVTPASTLPTLSFSGDYTDGGASSQSSRDHQDHFELQDMTTMSIGAHAIKFGTRLRQNRDANYTDSNFNGTYMFSTANSATPQPANSSDLVLTRLIYSTGPKSFAVSTFDAALFFQDDWKFNKFLTLSGGLRWESQNHVADHNDWAPRIAFAYALDGHKSGQTKTVLRAGYGFFYDRFSLGNILNADRLSGGANSVNQVQIVNPTCYLSTTICDTSGGTSSLLTTYQISPSYHSPYMEQGGLTLERQLNKASTLTLTYLHTYGVHQMVTRDLNQPTAQNLNPATGYLDQYDSEAIFKQNQINVGLNGKVSKNFTVRGFYNFTLANTDGAGGNASDASNLMKDWGRANFASRHMLFLMGTYNAPYKISLNPFLIAETGKPFNITTGSDIEENGFYNSRPAYATNDPNCTDTAAGDISTPYGCFNTDPASGYTPVPVNLGQGSSLFAFNLRASRTWGFGPKLASADPNASNNQQRQGPMMGGGPGGPGGGGGGRGMGGPGGGPGGGAASSGRKYSLTFSAQALNLFNNVNYAVPNGTLNSPNFNHSTSLMGMMFSQGPASRRIFFQTTFSF